MACPSFDFLCTPLRRRAPAPPPKGAYGRPMVCLLYTSFIYISISNRRKNASSFFEILWKRYLHFSLLCAIFFLHKKVRILAGFLQFEFFYKSLSPLSGEFRRHGGIAMKHIGLFAAGVLFGTAGLKLLGSKDAKKVLSLIHISGAGTGAYASGGNAGCRSSGGSRNAGRSCNTGSSGSSGNAGSGGLWRRCVLRRNHAVRR